MSKNVAGLRRDYEQVKRLYKKAGKAAMGKAKSSAVYKEYKVVKRAYKKIGTQLGKATKLKPRR